MDEEGWCECLVITEGLCEVARSYQSLVPIYIEDGCTVRAKCMQTHSTLLIIMLQGMAIIRLMKAPRKKGAAAMQQTQVGKQRAVMTGGNLYSRGVWTA